MTAENWCEVIGADRAGPLVLCCDHATNHVPECVSGGDLGLPPERMDWHIAYDIGAEGVTRALADLLGAPAVLSRFSRLVIDPNRAAWDPTLVRQIYDATVIPGNRTVDQAERARRIRTYYQPYHDALEATLSARPDAVLVSVHSFTPNLTGQKQRPWHYGILSSPHDRRLSEALIARLAAKSEAPVGDNEPYSGHLPGDTVDQHALAKGRHNTLIEIRNDLIATPDDQTRIAAWLAPIIKASLGDIGL